MTMYQELTSKLSDELLVLYDLSLNHNLKEAYHDYIVFDGSLCSVEPCFQFNPSESEYQLLRYALIGVDNEFKEILEQLEQEVHDTGVIEYLYNLTCTTEHGLTITELKELLSYAV